MTGPRFVLRMAAREIRAAPRRLALLSASIAVGVAALVAINSFADNLRDSVRRQARALLGADVSISTRRPFTPKIRSLLDSLAGDRSRPAAVAYLTNFSAMAFVPRTSGTRLVQVSAVNGPYPLHGEVRTEPAAAWSALQAGNNVVVDPSLLTALDAGVGDTVALGEARFTIVGTIVSSPGNAGIRSAFGPKVYIPANSLGETRLLAPGARVEYEAFVRFAPGVSAEQVASRYRAMVRTEGARLRTASEDQADLNRTFSRLTSYLGLVALIALLLGGVGVASAVVVFVRQRLDTIAVLRCLGATSGEVFTVYLVEAALLGLLGSVAGAVAGVGVQRLLPGVLGGFLPVDVTPTLSWPAVATGIGMGVWVTVAFALLPLLSVRLVAPLAALRRPYESEARPRDPWRWPAALLLVASAVALAVLQVGSQRRAAIFVAGVAVALLLLWLAARGLVRLLRRWPPASLPFAWRQGLANLHRPANQTTTVILSIGLGAFLLGTLLLVQHNLLLQLRITGGPSRPNLVLFDIQPDQLEPLDRMLERDGLPRVGPVPIVPMRIQSIGGKPVAQLLGDTSGAVRIGAWALRREYRSTYRDTLVASERVVAGQFNAAAPAGVVPISVELDLAGELGISVGEDVVWDVQGVPVRSRVTSLREVEWARFEPNFFVVFGPGALDEAPRTFVLLTRVADAGARGRFQRALAERFANVSTLDLTLVQETLERLLARVVLAIRFTALFTLVTGALVLVAALATSRFQRIREGALLRTLGASRGQVFRVVLAEYAALGVLASLVGGALATVAAWALARFLFEGPFTVPMAGVGALAAGVVGLTVLVGMAASRDVVARPPLDVLRAEP